MPVHPRPRPARDVGLEDGEEQHAVRLGAAVTKFLVPAVVGHAQQEDRLVAGMEGRGVTAVPLDQVTQAPPRLESQGTTLPKARWPGRRDVLVGLAGSLLPLAAIGAGRTDPFEALERACGGKLGVYAVDTGTGRSLGHRPDERQLMCSIFKLLLAAAVLARVDQGKERLDRRVPYGAGDLLAYAPVSRARLAEGGLAIGALCRAAVEVSDNTAANLLLGSVGGPAGVTRFARGLGDGVTRLDRVELALNDPDGLLDTTTPRAFAGLARTILLGPALAPASRATLESWMVACATGRRRLRAGLPASWSAGDKTGTANTQTNDLAIIRPPGRAPLILAAFYQGGPAATEGRDAVLQQLGSVVARWFA